ncbi:MAG: acyl-CoA reductase, partial [Alphaproteobacteria bacterium]
MSTLDREGARAAVERLQRAGAEWASWPIDRRVARLARVAASWLDDRARLDEAADAIARATGYAPAMVRECLARAFAAFDGRGLREALAESRAWLAGDGRARAHAPRLVVAVLAQNTPGLAIAPVFSALALGAPVLVKSASGEDTFAPRLASSLARVDETLGRACEAHAWRGGDATVED